MPMRIPPPSPYDHLPAVASFSLTSINFSDGAALPRAQMSGIFGAGGEDASPQLSWSGQPEATQSFAVTCLDLDAPTGVGFWHWLLTDIPADVTELALGAGSADGAGLPAGARHWRNDAGLAQYLGSAPPEGDGEHRYLFAVNALSVPRLEVPDDVMPGMLGFNIVATTIGRGVITGTTKR